jgi:phosphatidylglycerophosphatase A
LTRPSVRWITVFGLGYRWPASGTWGSLPPVLLGAVFMIGAHQLLESDGALTWLIITYRLALAAILIIFSLACVAQGDGAEARFLKKDPSQAVADETAGQCLPLLVLPLVYETPAKAALALLTAFLSFRAMDILKPPPARQIQKAPAGWGILLDDLIAGVYAALITYGALSWLG